MVDQIKYKNELARLCNKGRIDKETYTNYRNRLNKVLRETKADYFSSEFSDNKGNIKGTWDVINKSIKINTKFKKLVIKENDKILDQKDLPYKFINYFSNIAHKLTSKIKPVNTNFSQYLSNKSFKTFFMCPIIDKDIELAISNLKSCNGVHNISTLVLKESKSLLAVPLSHIFNLCVEQGYFPTELKKGCITPIYKKR